MIWTDTPCRTTCWGGGNETIEAMRNPKIECVVAQHPWLENDTLYADIILPSNTTLEIEDIVANTRWHQYLSVAIQKEAIKPIGESKSDREVVLEIAKKLEAGRNFRELGIKPVFRLSPPSGGLRSVRVAYPRGDLGERKEAVNELLRRMV